jgi:2-polyprenyl-3-methyl-5-hydroxy-6-metoxy-1,4-benzoquinol methylase
MAGEYFSVTGTTLRDDLLPALHQEVVRSGWRLVETLERMRPERARALLRDDLDAQARHAAETLPPLTKWDLVPDRAWRVYTNKPDQVRMRRVLDFIEPGDRLLDIGAGYGYLTGVVLRDSGASYYCGIDLGEHIVASSRRMTEVNGLRDRVEHHLEPRDLYSLTPEWVAGHSPDLLVCCEVLEHVPDAEAAVATMARTMPRDGALLFTVPILGRLETCWGHVSLFSAERIRRMVEGAGLRVHHVEPLFNTWVLVLASPSPEPPSRLLRILRRPPVRACAGMLPDSAFVRVPTNGQRLRRGNWCRSSRTDLSFDRGEAHVQVRAQAPKPVARAAPLPLRGLRALRRAAGAVARPRERSGYGGVSFDVNGLSMLRLELAFRQPENLRNVFVDAYDGRRRVVRWRWEAARHRPPETYTTYVLRVGEATGRFLPAKDADGASARRVELFVEVRAGTGAGMDVRRVAYIGHPRGHRRPDRRGTPPIRPADAIG